MHPKQRFAVVVQQVQANVLAQLGSNPFQPHPGATSRPNHTSCGTAKEWVILERKIVMLCSAVQRRKGQGHEGRGLLT